MEEQRQMLRVRNTFLNVTDMNTEAREMSRSQSDSSLSSSSVRQAQAQSDEEPTVLVGQGHWASTDQQQLSDSSTTSSESEPPVNDGNDTSAKEKVEQQQQSAASATDRKSWSVGSKLHSSGQCKPCAWNWKPSGCVQRASCIHCHLCDDNAFMAFQRDRLAALKASQANRKNNQLAAHAADPAKGRDPNSSS